MGRVLWDLGGQKGKTYAVNLGHKYCNKEEALSILKGLSILKNKGIEEAKIIRESCIIIDSMMKGRELANPLLNLYIKKSKSLLHNFKKIEFLHVSQEIKWIVDKNVKAAMVLNPSQLLTEETTLDNL